MRGGGAGTDEAREGVIVLDIATARAGVLAALSALCTSSRVRRLLGVYVVGVFVARKVMREAPEVLQCQAAVLGASVGMQRLLVIAVVCCLCAKECECDHVRDA